MDSDRGLGVPTRRRVFLHPRLPSPGVRESQTALAAAALEGTFRLQQRRRTEELCHQVSRRLSRFLLCYDWLITTPRSAPEWVFKTGFFTVIIWVNNKSQPNSANLNKGAPTN